MGLKPNFKLFILWNKNQIVIGLRRSCFDERKVESHIYLFQINTLTILFEYFKSITLFFLTQSIYHNLKIKLCYF